MIPLRPGTWVVGEGLTPCRRCPACNRGESTWCVEPEHSGMSFDGGFAPLAWVPARALHPVNPGAYVLVEPAASVLRAAGTIVDNSNENRDGRPSAIVARRRGPGPSGLPTPVVLRPEPFPRRTLQDCQNRIKWGMRPAEPRCKREEERPRAAELSGLADQCSLASPLGRQQAMIGGLQKRRPCHRRVDGGGDARGSTQTKAGNTQPVGPLPIRKACL